MVASDMPRCERIEKRADPTMMHTYIGDRYERSQRPGDIELGVRRLSLKGYHETGEDHAKRSCPRVKNRGPEEDEDVHAGLQQGLHAPQQQDLFVLERNFDQGDFRSWLKVSHPP